MRRTNGPSLYILCSVHGPPIIEHVKLITIMCHFGKILFNFQMNFLVVEQLLDSLLVVRRLQHGVPAVRVIDNGLRVAGGRRFWHPRGEGLPQRRGRAEHLLDADPRCQGAFLSSSSPSLSLPATWSPHCCQLCA